jgi:ankyrin repeat protein
MNYVISSHAWESLMIKTSDGDNALHVAAKYARPEVMCEFRHIAIKVSEGQGQNRQLTNRKDN